MKENQKTYQEYNPEYYEEYDDDAIDFKALASQLWNRRKYILKVVGVCAALGFLFAIFQTPVYVARCSFVPQSSSSRGSSSLSSLAAIAGINMGDMTSSQTLSPLVYPQLLSNTEFSKELMNTPLHFKKFQEPISLYTKMTDRRYQTFNLGAAVKQYTIGLPFLILQAIKGKPKDVEMPKAEGGKESDISVFSAKEYKISKSLGKLIGIDVDKKEGYITVSAKMNEPVAAAELCQATYDLMQKYVSDFKLQNARSNETYIRERYEEARANYEQKQLALAQFSDANRGNLTATAQIRKEQLQADFSLAQSLFLEMSKQLLQAEMIVKEDTPVLSAIYPVTIPMEKSNSRSKTLIIWIFLGFFVACGSVLIFDWLKNQGIEWPKNWE